MKIILKKSKSLEILKEALLEAHEKGKCLNWRL